MSEAAAATATGETTAETATEGQTAQAGMANQAGSGGGQSSQMSGKEASAARQEVINELGAADMDKLVTLKINGKEEKLPLKEALKISRLEKVSQAKMQEAAQIAKQAQQMQQFAKQNPKAFFQQLGIDPYEFAEATLAEKYEMMQLTPEQKKIMEYEQKLKAYEELEKNKKMTREQQMRMAEETKIRGELEKDIVEAWKDSGLPRHKYFAARISAEMLSSIAQKKAGLIDEPLQAKEAAARVKESVVKEFQNILMSVAKENPEAAQKMLGDELLKIFRDYDVKRVTGGNPASKTSSQSNRPASAVSGKSKNMSKPMTEKEWNDYFKTL